MPVKYFQMIALAVIFALQFLFEHIYPQRKEVNDWKNERYNITIGLVNIILSLLPAAAMVSWLHLIDEKKFGLLQQFSFSFPVHLLLAIFILDAWMYAWHRLNHTLPFLWRFHAFHHRDKKMNSTTALRFHFVELLFSYPGKALVCFIAGISYPALLVYELLFFTSVVIHHSNIYTGKKFDNVYKKVFVSPHMHRIHHSTRKEETHSNFSSLFSFWDRLFGSWTEQPKGPIVFGVDE